MRSFPSSGRVSSVSRRDGDMAAEGREEGGTGRGRQYSSGLQLLPKSGEEEHSPGEAGSHKYSRRSNALLGVPAMRGNSHGLGTRGGQAVYTPFIRVPRAQTAAEKQEAACVVLLRSCSLPDRRAQIRSTANQGTVIFRHTRSRFSSSPARPPVSDLVLVLHRPGVLTDCPARTPALSDVHARPVRPPCVTLPYSPTCTDFWSFPDTRAQHLPSPARLYLPTCSRTPFFLPLAPTDAHTADAT